MTRRLIPIVLLILAVVCATGRSQTIDTRIEGSVIDEKGAAIFNAAVTAHNLETGNSVTTATSEEGTFRFPIIRPG